MGRTRGRRDCAAGAPDRGTGVAGILALFLLTAPAGPVAGASGDADAIEAVGFGAVGIPAAAPAVAPAGGAGCADVDDELAELWRGAAVLRPPVAFVRGRVSRRHFEEAIRGRYVIVSERGPSGVALFVTNEGRLGRLLYRWRGVDPDGAPLLELHRIELADAEPAGDRWRALPARRLRAGEAVDLDPPGDGWGAGPDLRHVRAPSGPVFEAAENAELVLAATSMCEADRVLAIRAGVRDPVR